jgi:hypothetical protein
MLAMCTADPWQLAFSFVVAAAEQVDVDFATLENDFAVAQPARARAPGTLSTRRQLPTVSITDPKRAQNIAIRLSKFRPLSPAQVMSGGFGYAPRLLGTSSVADRPNPLVT